MNEQTNRLGRTILQNTMPWVLEELLELSRRMDALEAERLAQAASVPCQNPMADGDLAWRFVEAYAEWMEKPVQSWRVVADKYDLPIFCGGPTMTARMILAARKKGEQPPANAATPEGNP